jgi:hypothetical protein
VEVTVAGEAKSEAQRRARVVKGWAFRQLTAEQKDSIRAYLDGGPCPAEYARLDALTK